MLYNLGINKEKIMKKQLFLLPLLGGLLLTGCKITIGNKTIYLFEKKSEKQQEQQKEGEKQDDKEKLPDNFCEEFKGYKLAREVKDGGRYKLGVYRQKENLMRFVNGDYHRDSKGYYPFYMATVAGNEENCMENAAEIEVKFVGNDEFTMQVFAEGQVWHQKYIAVYAASSSFGNQVMSIALLDTPDQTSYTNPKDSKTFTDLTSHFKFYTEFNDTVAYAPAAPFQYPDVDEEIVPKFMGTGHASEGADYTSVDCKSYEAALDYENYDLAHLYEKK